MVEIAGLGVYLPAAVLDKPFCVALGYAVMAQNDWALRDHPAVMQEQGALTLRYGQTIWKRKALDDQSSSAAQAPAPPPTSIEDDLLF